jgi:hypothetical protein
MSSVVYAVDVDIRSGGVTVFWTILSLHGMSVLHNS